MSGSKKNKKISIGNAKKLVDPIPGELTDDYRNHGLKYSFEDFDSTQSLSLDEWGKLNHLRDTLNRLYFYSKERKFKSVFDTKFKTYPQFPENSQYKFPKHITEDAKWSSMHIGNKPCLIGHIVKDTFFIVFFDPEHKFYPTKK